MTILWIKKTFRNFRFYSDFFLCPITSSIDFGSVLSLPQQENAERKIKFMIIWNQDEIVISCFMNLSWQFRILILNEKLFSINSFAAWIFWCWKITRIRKKKPLEFCVWVCVSVCGSGAKICRKLLISYKKKIVLKNNRFLKIFVLQSPTSRTICSNHWKAKRSIKSQCPNFCWDEMSFQQKSRLIQLQMTNITTLLKVCCF